MRYASLVMCLLVCAAPAFAEEKQGEELHVAEVCKLLVEHKPTSDVEYKGGEDVHGNPVVEADINPSPVVAPKDIQFEVTVDVAKNLGLAVPAGTEGKIKVGTITVKEGQPYFDGKPMDGEAAENLRVMCAKKDKVNDDKHH